MKTGDKVRFGDYIEKAEQEQSAGLYL